MRKLAAREPCTVSTKLKYQKWKMNHTGKEDIVLITRNRRLNMRQNASGAVDRKLGSRRNRSNSFLQEFQQFSILLGGSDGYPQAILAVQLVTAESHHDSVIRHTFVDRLRVIHLLTHASSSSMESVTPWALHEQVEQPLHSERR